MEKVAKKPRAAEQDRRRKKNLSGKAPRRAPEVARVLWGEAPIPVQGAGASAEHEAAGRAAAVSSEPATRATATMPSGKQPPGPTAKALAGSRGETLPEDLRTEMETVLGEDLSAVRVHIDEPAADLADQVGARAFTLADDIYFSTGAFQPNSETGKRLLAHELTHVVQQRNGPALIMREPNPDKQPLTGPLPIPEMVANLEGLDFRFPPETRLRPGPSMVQIMEAAAARLVGRRLDQKEQNQFFATLKTVIKTGKQNGSLETTGKFMDPTTKAEGGEEIKGEIQLDLNAVAIIGAYLEKEIGPLKITEAQRKLLRLGRISQQAFLALFNVHKTLIDGKKLPSNYAWYHKMQLPTWIFPIGYHFFAGLVAQHAAALESLEKEVKDGDQYLISQAMENLVSLIYEPLQAMEWMRRTQEAAEHKEWSVLYKKIWNQDNPKTYPDKPDSNMLSNLYHFLGTQPQIVSEARAGKGRARVEILERFGRFHKYGAVTKQLFKDQELFTKPAQYNLAPLPSHLVSSPQLAPPMFSAVRDTDYRFHMAIHFTDVFQALGARYGGLSFHWDKVRIENADMEKLAALEGFAQLSNQKLESKDLVDSALTKDGDNLKDAARKGTGSGQSSYGERLGNQMAKESKDLQADLDRVDSPYLKAISKITSTVGIPGVGIENLLVANSFFRGLGRVLSTTVSHALKPSDEANFIFPQEGLYLVRCAAMPVIEGREEVIRAPSLAYLPVWSRDPKKVAETQVNNLLAGEVALLREIIKLRKELENPDKLKKAELKEKQERLKLLESSVGPISGRLSFQKAELEKRRDYLQAQIKAKPKQALLYQEELHSVTSRLEQISQILEMQKDRKLKDPRRLRIVFISDSGKVIQLSMEYEHQKPEKDGDPHKIRLSDLTHNRGSIEEATGKSGAEALKKAVTALMEGTKGYGRGQVSYYRKFGDKQGAENFRVEKSLGALSLEVLQNITTAAALAAMVAVPFAPQIAMAVLVPIGVVGAIPSGYQLVRDGKDGTLRNDLGTWLAVVDLLAAFAGVGAAGASFKGARAGTMAAGLRWSKIENGLLIMGAATDASSFLLIGGHMLTQIEAVKKKGLPPGETQAEIMKILGGTLMQMGMIVGGNLVSKAGAEKLAIQKVIAEPGSAPPPAKPATDGPTAHPEPPAAKAPDANAKVNDQASGSGDLAPHPVDKPAAEPKPAVKTDEPTPASKPKVPDTTAPEPAPAKKAAKGEDTDATPAAKPEEPGLTMAGSDKGGDTRRKNGGDTGDANQRGLEQDRARAREALRRPPPKFDSKIAHKTGQESPPIKVWDDAFHLYQHLLFSADYKVEVGIYRHMTDGHYIVKVGDPFQINFPKAGGYGSVLHFHPNQGNVLTYRLPSPVDVMNTTRQRPDGNAPKTEFIEFRYPNGDIGRTVYQVGGDPPKVRITLEGSDGTRKHLDFDSPDAYREYWNQRKVAVDPDSDLYKWLMKDIKEQFGHHDSLMDGKGSSGAKTGSRNPPKGDQSSGPTRSTMASNGWTRPAEATKSFGIAEGVPVTTGLINSLSNNAPSIGDVRSFGAAEKSRVLQLARQEGSGGADFTTQGYCTHSCGLAIRIENLVGPNNPNQIGSAAYIRGPGHVIVIGKAHDRGRMVYYMFDVAPEQFTTLPRYMNDQPASYNPVLDLQRHQPGFVRDLHNPDGIAVFNTPKELMTALDSYRVWLSEGKKPPPFWAVASPLEISDVAEKLRMPYRGTSYHDPNAGGTP